MSNGTYAGEADLKMGVATELSSLDQIQQAEIEVMRRVAAAREVVRLTNLLNEAQCGIEMRMPKVQILNNLRLEPQGERDSLPLYAATLDKNEGRGYETYRPPLAFDLAMQLQT